MPPPTSINRLTALSRGISFRFWFFLGSLIAPTDLYLSSRILLVPTGNSVSKRDKRKEKKKEEKKKQRKRLHRDDLSSRASIIFQLLGRTSTRWDSCIPDVIGVGFAAANVTGEIRRPRMVLERGIKNGYCPGSDVPSRASEDFKEEWSGRRNPSTINAAITSAIGVIGRVYQPALIHCSRGKKNEDGIVFYWKQERTRWGLSSPKSDLLSLKEAHCQ
ncbi:hypothetical protein ALC53_11933 [Atta colombica]|uniref:Uncharacterized protein n=1 Tax=Atta colombica TaxID=520822 RepID=A0A195AZX0_9HYME|nr:hypothetical protein ALC53_11933 [Atta colombica]